MSKATDTGRSDGFLNAGYAVITPDGVEKAFVIGQTRPGGPVFVDPTARLRMASIAKAATARAVCALVVGADLSLDDDLLDLLVWPNAPIWLRQNPISLRHLLAHTSGLVDHAGYLVDVGQSLTDHISDHPAAMSKRTPGTYFAYANLNYILLGHIIEQATGRRFDQILRDEVLAPAGIAGGFNWAGVPAPERAQRLPLYQREDAGLTIQADADDADWHADLIWRGGRGHSFGDYRLGQDTSLLSPHAGLRMNIIEAARLARFLNDGSQAAKVQGQVAWQFDPLLKNGEDCDGLFTAFGLGLSIYENHPRIPGHLIGHAGHALGFTGGVWHNLTTATSHAYFLTGGRDETAGLDTETFYGLAELSIMEQL